jgi:hypothetical protein
LSVPWTVSAFRHNASRPRSDTASGERGQRGPPIASRRYEEGPRRTECVRLQLSLEPGTAIHLEAFCGAVGVTDSVAVKAALCRHIDKAGHATWPFDSSIALRVNSGGPSETSNRSPRPSPSG